jgi:hypothetical protein
LVPLPRSARPWWKPDEVRAGTDGLADGDAGLGAQPHDVLHRGSITMSISPEMSPATRVAAEPTTR